MSLLQIFKKKKASPKKENFSEWAERCSEKELEEYCEKIFEGKEFDYTKMMWGHAFTTSRRYGKYIQYGSGFHGRILGCQRPNVGSVLLMKTEAGKIARYLILNIEWERDPDDMFWAYIVGIGYKE